MLLNRDLMALAVIVSLCMPGVLAPGSLQNLALISLIPDLLGAPQINFAMLPKLFLLSPCSPKNFWVAPWLFSSAPCSLHFFSRLPGCLAPHSPSSLKPHTEAHYNFINTYHTAVE